jgi:DNA-binding response OmpR family regulator
MNLIKRIKQKLIKKPNVLVVDDIESNVELIVSYLNILNIKSYKSMSSIESEKLLKTIDFSLIILDIQMPYIDGYELATNIKYGKYNRNEKTPIMFVTGIYNSDIDKMKGYNIGSIDYILKPIDYDSFLYKVKKYVKKDDKELMIDRFNNIKKSIEL